MGGYVSVGRWGGAGEGTGTQGLSIWLDRDCFTEQWGSSRAMWELSRKRFGHGVPLFGLGE